ncbi:DUF2721 domain-containing protein [Synechococcus sp. Lug-A]|jgi:magnesium-transporting ATPase (P-type)|uniref:DUF2721 domain-containing protein n=1 Tax=unclassified Synechococcus TaxID=2626047 RepID=UPI0020CC7D37|nr:MULTISPECIES: DUF2721 domain-containing protein [unclassified Synechococcus]MCP9828773.1 DUF2721 domain-containing protein [Synechococcus sp. L2F]MCP9845466.1 DUF2721 domain-containing protein [Synechococcus sp. Lug-A]
MTAPDILVLAAGTESTAAVAKLSYAIQLSVAPVFLLTGITGLLSMFTQRLARIVDRTRLLQEALARGTTLEARRLRKSLDVQKKRMFLINRAIFCVTFTALLIAAVVAVMFVSAVAVLDLAAILVPAFVLAMLMLIVGLVLFLQEVQLAISQNPKRYY